MAPPTKPTATRMAGYADDATGLGDGFWGDDDEEILDLETLDQEHAAACEDLKQFVDALTADGRSLEEHFAEAWDAVKRRYVKDGKYLPVDLSHWL